MSATIGVNDLKFVIFGAGHDYTLADSGDGDVQVFSHPFVPLNSVMYAGQWYFLAPDENGDPMDCVKDDIAHCTFTPALGTAFSTEGETTVECHYHREYVYAEETVVVDKTVSQTIEVVNHGSVTTSASNYDQYSDGYCFIRPISVNSVGSIGYTLGTINSATKLSSIPWRQTELGRGIYPFIQRANILTDISELQYADTSNVVRMILFAYVLSLEDITPLESWNTSNVTEFGPFATYSQIKNLKALKNWNVSKVTTLDSFCYRMNDLESLEGLEDWNVENLEYLTSFCLSCPALKDISALLNWNTKKLVSVNAMLSGCSGLLSLHGLENWNVENVTDMRYMCNGCSGIDSLDPLLNWKAKPTSIDYAFRNCSKIQTIEGLANLDLSQCTSMIYTFESCTRLLSLHGAEDWDTSKITNFLHAFYNDFWISDISAIDNWDFSSATNMQSMFGFVCALLSLDDVDLDLSNVTASDGLKGMFMTTDFGYYPAGDCDVYFYNYGWVDYAGNWYSQVGNIVNVYAKSASNAENWNVSISGADSFTAQWSNIPSWN